MINGRSITIVLIFMSTLLVDVQAEDEGLVDAVPNYMFSAVLGSGFYRVEDATLTTVRIPFSKTLRELNAEQDGIKLLLPVTVGYVSLDPDDLIDKWLPTELGTLSFIPGVEYQHIVNENLVLKPFAQLGAGYDFENGILSGLVVGGGRALWTKQVTTEWQIQLGSALQWTAGWQEGDGPSSSFGLFELGADFRRDLPIRIGERQVNGSVFCRWRKFLNDWNIAESPDDPISVNALYELGLSVGVNESYDIYGMQLSRLSVAYVWGEDTKAVSFGMDFPF
jgi:hypothetical protein